MSQGPEPNIMGALATKDPPECCPPPCRPPGGNKQITGTLYVYSDSPSIGDTMPLQYEAILGASDSYSPAIVLDRGAVYWAATLILVSAEALEEEPGIYTITCSARLFGATKDWHDAWGPEQTTTWRSDNNVQQVYTSGAGTYSLPYPSA